MEIAFKIGDSAGAFFTCIFGYKHAAPLEL